MAEKEAVKILQTNKKAYHDYFVEEVYECGIELYGTEVKSVRLGEMNLKDSYCDFKDGELFVCGMHISPYEKGNVFNREPYRQRKLLLHKREILKLFGWVKRDGYTVIPLKMYLKGPRVKVEIGLCKGKKLYDKRDDMARRAHPCNSGCGRICRNGTFG